MDDRSGVREGRDRGRGAKGSLEDCASAPSRAAEEGRIVTDPKKGGRARGGRGCGGDAPADVGLLPYPARESRPLDGVILQNKVAQTE